MVKIFLLKLIKSKKFWTSIIMLTIVSWIYINGRVNVAHLNRQLENSQRERLEQKKSDSLAIVKEVEKNKELEGVILTQTKMTAQWKDLYFDLQAKQDTTTTGSIRVSFKKESECIKVWGFTETATEKQLSRASVYVKHKPIEYTVEFLPVGNEIYGYIRPDKACVDIKNVSFSVPPSLFTKKRGGKSGIFWFLVGGVTGVSLLYLISN